MCGKVPGIHRSDGYARSAICLYRKEKILSLNQNKVAGKQLFFTLPSIWYNVLIFGKNNFEKIRIKYPKAYTRRTPEDEKYLILEFNKGTSIEKNS